MNMKTYEYSYVVILLGIVRTTPLILVSVKLPNYFVAKLAPTGTIE